MSQLHTLLVDNYDSYTYNLFQLVSSITGHAPQVVRNDDVSFEQVAPQQSLTCASPGPLWCNARAILMCAAR
jgi:anthranilate/para-aminobenzoate synthase component II